jgi:hypothetical protein
MSPYQLQIRTYLRKDTRDQTTESYGSILWEEPRAQVHLTQPDIVRWRVSLAQTKAEKFAKDRGEYVAICSHRMGEPERVFDVECIVNPPSKNTPHVGWEPVVVRSHRI